MLLLQWAAVLLSILVTPSDGLFSYPDFNSTLGLQLLGSARTTNCNVKPANKYAPGHEQSDVTHTKTPDKSRGWRTESVQLRSVTKETTDNPVDTSKIGSQTAVIGHRDNYEPVRPLQLVILPPFTDYDVNMLYHELVTEY